jgi:hypothetical protein
MYNPTLIACIWDMRYAYRVLVGKPEGSRPLGTPRRRWEDKVKMYIKDLEWEGVDWIHLAQDRGHWRALCEHGNEPSGSIKCGEFLD